MPSSGYSQISRLDGMPKKSRSDAPDRVVLARARRTVADVDLAALVPLATARIVEQEVGVGDARPVFELRLVQRGGEVGIVALPEPAQEVRLDLGREAVEDHRVALGGDRADVLEALAHAVLQPRERRAEGAVRALDAGPSGSRCRRPPAWPPRGRDRRRAPAAPRRGGREVAPLDQQRDLQEPGIDEPGTPDRGGVEALDREVERGRGQVLEPVAPRDLSEPERRLGARGVEELGALEPRPCALEETRPVIGLTERELVGRDLGGEQGGLLELADRDAAGVEGAAIQHRHGVARERVGVTVSVRFPPERRWRW